MELVIAVAIVAILAAIAIPSYQEYLIKSRRTEAVSALLQAAAAQEKYFLSNNTYTINFTDLGMPVDTSYQSPTQNGHYVLDIRSADANNFTIAAVPAADSPQASDPDCDEFLIDEQGRVTATKGFVDATEQCVAS